MGSSTELVTINNGQCSTTVTSYGYGSNATTSCSAPTKMPVNKWRGSWVCVRVEPENCCGLPKALRPPEAKSVCAASDAIERVHARG